MNTRVSRILLRKMRIDESEYLPLAEFPDSDHQRMVKRYWDDIRDGLYLMAPRSDMGGYGLFLQGGDEVDDLVVSFLVALVTDEGTRVRQGGREPWRRFSLPWDRFSADNRAQVWSARAVVAIAKEFEDPESRQQYCSLIPGMPSRYPCPLVLGLLRLDKIPPHEWGVNEILELLRERKRWGRLTVVTSRLSISELGQKYGPEMQELLQDKFVTDERWL